MKLREIVLMAIITKTLGESEDAQGFQCDEVGRVAPASLGLSQDDLDICWKRKRNRGSKMAARLARVNDVEDQVLEKQAELLKWEQPPEEGDRAIELGKMVGKMMSFQMVRL